MARRIRTIVFNSGRVQGYLLSLPNKSLSTRTILALPAVLLIRLYQVWSNGRNVCRHPYPNNCSTLGIKAYANHGLAMGTVLIVALQLGGLFGSNKDRQGGNAQSQPPPTPICY